MNVVQLANLMKLWRLTFFQFILIKKNGNQP
ncbi:MAG: hypothetical protein ACJAUH_000203 [Saprospiraceae bacterium]|jgi:hypothetical protein